MGTIHIKRASAPETQEKLNPVAHTLESARLSWARRRAQRKEVGK